MGNILEPNEENVEILFKSRFCIPIYQRPYNWEESEISEFLNDIKQNYKNQDFLFAGTVYLNTDERINSALTKYNIIDGQQRIITLFLIIISYYTLAFKNKVENENEINRIKSLLWKSSEVNNRKLDQKQVLLETMGIEKNLIKLISDTAFSEPKEFEDRVLKYQTTNPIESRLLKNLKYIYKEIENSITLGGEDEFLNVCKYILENVRFIVIRVETNFKKMFEIFESINSKGKKLQTIDLIKSFIFRNLDEDIYNTCLEIWGNLINKTNDNLEDYLNIYIRAYLKYYDQTLTMAKFKSLCSDNGELKKNYGTDSISARIVKLLQDMNNRVDNYLALQNYDPELILGRNPNHKFKYFLECLKYMSYKHPKALIFRAICEYKENKNMEAKDNLISITKNSFVFMFCFQTLFNRDSKDSIKTFSKIMEGIYENGIKITAIEDSFKNDLSIAGLSDIKIQSQLMELSGFDKQESRILLSAFEFYDKSRNKIDYDRGLIILKNAKEIEIDHICPQTPKKDDDNFTYYSEENDGIQVLKLKPEHDFRNPNIVEGMDYEIFIELALNKLGNLRLEWKDSNNLKSNKLISFPDYKAFNTYKQITDRSKEIADRIYDCDLFKIN